ncbi:MAG: DUF3971 domain-containing protein [Pseudomonadota bacterium]
MLIAAVIYVVVALSSGPLSVGFLTNIVENRVSDSIPGLKVELERVVIERGSNGGHPTLRLADVRLTDTSGNLIARAPRAAIAVDIGEILTGNVKPKKLELIGARILARRDGDGNFAMGFSVENQTTGKSDAGSQAVQPYVQPDSPADGSTRSVVETINNLLQNKSNDPGTRSLEAIEVTDAQISFKDEIQNQLWISPRANLRFKHADGGFALFMDADISADGPTWRTEVLTTYRTDSSVFKVIAKVDGVTPADVARKLFAFNQLANIDLPMSGEMEFSLSNKGEMLAGSGVLSVKAGKVSFPGYISDPVLIDEGLLRLKFEPQTGHLSINDSSLVIRGTEAKFNGRFAPVRNEQQEVIAANIQLDAQNVNIDTPNAGAAGSVIDQFKLRGQALFNERRFLVDDLLVLSGDGGVRVRGQFVADGDAVGVYMAGRGRSLQHDLIRKLWPPVIAAQSRKWYRENLRTGVVDDAEFRVKLSGAQINTALEGKPLPADAVDLKFNATGVEFTYADDLPPMTRASGQFHLTGQVFDIAVQAGTIPLPSGNSLGVTGGNMQITELALPISPATLNLNLESDVAGFHEYADLPPLALVSDSTFDLDSVSGRGVVNLSLAMPLKPGITSSDIAVAATAKLSKGQIKNAIEGIDINDAEIDLVLDDTIITGKGTAKLGEKAARLTWRRPLSKSANADEDMTISATLSDADRQKLGIDLAPFLTGPTRLTVSMVRRGSQIVSAKVDADLSKASMAVDAIGWSRKPTKNTRARFNVGLNDDKFILLDDLSVTGGKLKILGKLRVNRKNNSLHDASFPRFILSDTNQLALEVDNSSGSLQMGVGGASLDARPLISRIMSSKVGGNASLQEPPVSVNTNISRIYVHRGEVINNLQGRLVTSGGAVQSAEIRGKYRNGAPITMRVTRDNNGQRRMRVTGRDAGASLRATNLYSKISGGTIDFGAILGNPGQGAIQRGLLEVRNFSVRNEAALSQIDNTTRRAGRNTGPRSNDLRLSRLSVPFSVDNNFVRIGDALVQGPEIGASAQGIIRKNDLAMDIGGTIIPAYALNSAISNVPVLGDVLTGGRGQGVFGLNFALKGSMNRPRFLVNPVSAIAPGIFRNIFTIGGGQTNSDGTARGSRQQRGTIRQPSTRQQNQRVRQQELQSTR